MTGPPASSRTNSSTAPLGKPLLVLAALCLLTLPQTYAGGAALPHPHAIFQFWFHGGHLSAAHHHGDGDDHDHDGDLAISTHLSPTDAVAAARAARAESPTVTQMTPPFESTDGIGGAFGDWFILLFAATAGLYLVRSLRQGLTPLPERPPPRFAITPT
jgi:hypothetical protein